MPDAGLGGSGRRIEGARCDEGPLDYGTAIERLRERRGLKRPSTDVLVRLATVLDMLPSDLLRHVEEVSAKGRGLFRKRVLEAPMHEHPAEAPEGAFSSRMLGPADRAELATEGSRAESKQVKGELVNELARLASALDPEDLKVLIALVHRLAEAKERNP